MEGITLVSASDELVKVAQRALLPIAKEMQVAADLVSMRTVLRQSGAQLIVLDLERIADYQQTLAVLADEQQEAKLLLLVRDHVALDKVMDAGHALNFLAIDEHGHINPVDLCVSVRQVIKDCGITLGDLVRGETFEHRVCSTREIESIVASVEEYAKSAGCNSRIAKNLGTVADELLSNALYNAPVEDGQRPYKARARSKVVELPPEQAAIIRWNSDGSRIGLSVEDCFGSLDADSVVKRVARAHVKQAGQVNLEGGGAGIGLRFILEMVHHLAISVEPMKRTEAIALVGISRSYSAYRGKSKSFSVFIGGGNHGS